MSIYRARLRYTSNALSPQVSSEQIRLQVPPKLFGHIPHMKFSNNNINKACLVSSPKIVPDFKYMANFGPHMSNCRSQDMVWTDQQTSRQPLEMMCTSSLLCKMSIFNHYLLTELLLWKVQCGQFKTHCKGSAWYNISLWSCDKILFESHDITYYYIQVQSRISGSPVAVRAGTSLLV